MEERDGLIIVEEEIAVLSRADNLVTNALVERLACADIRNRLPEVGDHFRDMPGCLALLLGRAAVRNAHCRGQRPLICATDKLIAKPNDLQDGAKCERNREVVDQVCLAWR